MSLRRLWKIVERGRLDYRLACVFRDAGHKEIKSAINELQLFDGMPAHMAIGCRERPLR